MKKSIALAIAAAMSLSVAGTALAANNPFSDVPEGHWAYDAVAQLEKAGLITGYGDGTYRGDKAMSRYEMATIVAQLDDANGENAELVNKLRSEFAQELYNLGVRVDKLEKNASTIKFSGDGWIRYQTGAIAPLMSLEDGHARDGKRWHSRIRINMNAKINEKVNFIGRVKYQYQNYRINPSNTDSGYSYTQDTFLDRAEILWKNGTFEGRFGRLSPTIGQGLIWGNKSTDGVLLGYKTKKWDIFGGVLDYRAQDPPHGDSTNELPAAGSKIATVVNIGYNFSDNFKMTAAYSDGHANGNKYNGEYPGFDLLAVGFNAKLGKDWNLAAEYIKNQADTAVSQRNAADKQDTGYWARLTWKNANMSKPGTYSIYAEYMNLEAYAIDSATYGHMLAVSAGNGYNPTQYKAFDNAGTGAAGAKGYGICLTYVVAKNVNMQLMYHDLSPTDKYIKNKYGDYRGIYQFYTNFRF